MSRVTIIVKSMKEFLHKTWDYLLDAGIATFTQLFVLLGPLFVLALFMNFISRKNENLSYKVLGQKIYLYVFGWLGTSVHELGHAIFAIIFAHKISEIKLFTPNSGKSLGQVKHSYTKGNPYQTIGNFFIGIGPILIGTFLLFVFTWYLFGLNIFNVAEKNSVIINFELFKSFDALKNAAVNIGSGVWECFIYILNGPKTNWWKLLLFFYFFYAVGSSISLSPSDIKGAFRGFIYFVILLFLFNIATIWKDDFILDFFSKTSNYFSGFYFLIILNLGLNIGFIVILWLIDLIISQLFQ
ncbi:MAG: hypothetical protein FD181_2914 [Prolixibacteraceae bacterium]|nr:MAG: hypothetical protein FD181_2914 [Prolixibacteraceae bacterium]